VLLEIFRVLAEVMGFPYKLRGLQKNLTLYSDLHEALPTAFTNAA
jgi:hypothetical protein